MTTTPPSSSVRPVKAAKISKDWKRLKGFKLEADWVGDRGVCSASLTALQHRDKIDDVAMGKRAIDKLFSKDQERFLGEFYKGSVDFGKLRVMVPIRVLRWKLKHKNFPHNLTLEEWRLPGGDDLVEVSIKTSPAQKEFDAHLRELGLSTRKPPRKPRPGPPWSTSPRPIENRSSNARATEKVLR
jgi:hypothetical protein